MKNEVRRMKDRKERKNEGWRMKNEGNIPPSSIHYPSYFLKVFLFLSLSCFLIPSFIFAENQFQVFLSPDNPVQIGKNIQIACKVPDTIITVIVLRGEDDFIYLKKESDGIWYGQLKVADSYKPGKYNLNFKFFYNDGTYKVKNQSYIADIKNSPADISSAIQGIQTLMTNIKKRADEIVNLESRNLNLLTLVYKIKYNDISSGNTSILKNDLESLENRKKTEIQIEAFLKERNQTLINMNQLIKKINKKSSQDFAPNSEEYFSYYNQLKILAADFQKFLVQVSSDKSELASDIDEVISSFGDIEKNVDLPEPKNADYLKCIDLLRDLAQLKKSELDLEIQGLELKREPIL